MPAPIAADLALSLSDPVPGAFVLSSTTFDLATVGYVAEERFLSGHANAFETPEPRNDDGFWTVAANAEAAFTTRLVIYRPSDPAKFSGTVLVEWINVSPATDVAPVWMWAHREMIRAGHIWIGISVQRAGLEGGGFYQGPAPPLKQADPQRYAKLALPGDAFAFDIYARATRHLRAAIGRDLLHAYIPRRFLSIGASQSAMCLVSYINGFANLHGLFDGYFLSGRVGGAFSLSGQPPAGEGAVRIRTDLNAPLIVVQSETDVAGKRSFFAARQDDTEKFRLWEIAGAAHLDTYNIRAFAIDSGLLPLDALATAYAPTDQFAGMDLGRQINCGPQQHYVLQAALAHLDTWSGGGPAPPKAERLSVISVDPPHFDLDAHGNAKGGVRTPWMDAPRAVLSGFWRPDVSPPSSMFGRTEPFTAAKLDALYAGGDADYRAKFAAATRRAVEAGFILGADEAEIIALSAYAA